MGEPAEVSKTIEKDPDGRRIYRPDGYVLAEYIRDTSHVSIIRGPIGSGTSSASCMKIWKLACEQRLGPDGYRRSRWGIVRNSFPDLRGSTVKTWLDWFPEDLYGRFFWDRPYRHIIRLNDVDLEVWFLALDHDEDVRKLRSTEFTGFWFNEGEFIDKVLVDEAESRTGRFPAIKDGGASWHGVLIDMNAPNEDHWVPMMFGEVPLPDEWGEDERRAFKRPENWEYFRQPPGLLEQKDAQGRVTGYIDNPAAENTRWLPKGYYLEKIQGKSKAWIDSRVMNRITLYVDGKPVHPGFNPDVHVAAEPIPVVPGRPVIVGLDFGRQPAAVFMQDINGRYSVLSELIGNDVGASIFAPEVKRHLAQKYPDCAYAGMMWGDPKGADKNQSDEQTAYDIFKANGVPVMPAPVKGNNIQTRIEAVDFVLHSMREGRPRLLISPACRTLKVGLAGGYHFPKLRGSNTYADEPNKKSRYSHVCDALQYALIGAGEGRAMTIDPARPMGKTVRLPANRGHRRFAGATRPF